jgi:hypothetical protein
MWIPENICPDDRLHFTGLFPSRHRFKPRQDVQQVGGDGFLPKAPQLDGEFLESFIEIFSGYR